MAIFAPGGFSGQKLKYIIGLPGKAVRVVSSQRSLAEQEQAILEFAEACRTDVRPIAGFPVWISRFLRV